MRSIKKTLLAAVAVAALGTGFAPQAHAFEAVNWTWDKTITEDSVRDVAVSVEVNPTGLLEIEKVQTQIGNVSATSDIHNISNTPPGELDNEGFALIDDVFTFTSLYDPAGPGGIVGAGPVTGANGQLEGTLLAGGDVNENANSLDFQVQATGMIALADLLVGTAQDGADLPALVGAATAVGNNQTIASDVAMELHDAQELYGDLNIDTGEQVAGSVAATSSVYEILNASVDSAATAVGNNTDVTLTAISADDALLTGDLTQYALAGITASSTVYDVDVNSYANLGALEGPLVSSKATAVGNNMSIKVTSPAL